MCLSVIFLQTDGFTLFYTHRAYEAFKYGHNSGIPYTPYSFRFRIRIRVGITIRIRVRVRVRD